MRLRTWAVALASLAVVTACTPAAPGASPAGSPGTSPAASPAGSPAASPGGTAGASVPADQKTVRIGIGGWSIAYMPTAIVIDRMKAMGYPIEATEIAGTSAQVQAFTQGQLDITSVSAAATMTAIDAGSGAKFFLTRNLNEFVLVAKKEFTSCQSLDGKRVAIHSQTDITGLLTKAWFAKNCPDAKPNIQIVEGSENRLAGLLQNQLDASPVDLGDAQQLDKQKPGEFTVLAPFVKDFPVLQGVFGAKPEWLAANQQFVKDFIRLHLEVWDEFYKDQTAVATKTKELVPELDAAIIPNLLKSYVDNEIFPKDGDLKQEQTQYTLDFFKEAAGFKNVGNFADVADRTYLDAVLNAR
jgi:ABC-type nitrate/sulfonate/bicarbonate transport system substrate-binding protein